MQRQMGAVSGLERGLISDRTKASLQAANARGVRLGSPRGCVMTDATRQADKGSRSARASDRAGDLASMIQATRNSGANSLREIAARLNWNGFSSPCGSVWKPMQIARGLKAALQSLWFVSSGCANSWTRQIRRRCKSSGVSKLIVSSIRNA